MFLKMITYKVTSYMEIGESMTASSYVTKINSDAIEYIYEVTSYMEIGESMTASSSTNVLIILRYYETD
jgi:hypothetical protein